MSNSKRLSDNNFPEFALRYQQIRFNAKSKRPYFLSELTSITPIMCEDVPLATIDQYWRIYLNTRFFNDLEFSEQSGILLKNMYHLMRLHFLRGNRIPVTRDNLIYWIVACDLEVNLRVIEAELKLPKWAIYPKDLGLEDNLLAEDYFRLIKDLDLKESIDGLPGLGLPGCGCVGSGITGVPSPWEIPPNTVGIPDVNDSERIQKGISGMQKDSDSICRGTQALLDELIVELTEGPKIPWHQILSNLVRRSIADFTRGGSKRTFRRPSRRAAFSPVILPRLVTSKNSVGVVLDTSGSMQGRLISQAYGLVKDLCLATGNRTRVVCCDAEPTQAQEAFAGGSFNLKLYGGGGTDMRIGINSFNDEPNPPDTVIVITDGDTPWPELDEMPGFPLVAVIVRRDSRQPVRLPPEHIKYVVAEILS